jgi:hypothetical protein
LGQQVLRVFKDLRVFKVSLVLLDPQGEQGEQEE